jgi:hypothetical protein
MAHSMPVEQEPPTSSGMGRELQFDCSVMLTCCDAENVFFSRPYPITHLSANMVDLSALSYPSKQKRRLLCGVNFFRFIPRFQWLEKIAYQSGSQFMPFGRD